MRSSNDGIFHKIGIVSLIFVLGFAGGFFAEQKLAMRSGGYVGSVSAPEGVDFSPVWKAWSVIDEKFVPASVASTTMIATSTAEKNQERVWGMVQGLAGALGDPYTYFLPPQENQSFAEDMSGAFEGVGMEIAIKNEVLTVVSPLKGTPADRAGIRAGDKVLKIDETDTAGLDVSSAVKKIRGPKGTRVKLLIAREAWGTPREISVLRDVINVPIIKTERKSGVFIISLASFTSNSPTLFRDALREFVESGDTKLVLDLRGNPGGYLEAAVQMASWFLPSGRVIVSEEYASTADTIVHRSLGYDIFNENLKMVILVDKGSASASEILAGALRYWKKGTLVGTNTFGKGSVQELVEITPDTSLKLTVARWLGPDGGQIPLDGIKPDVMATTTEEAIEKGEDPQMEAAIKLLQE